MNNADISKWWKKLFKRPKPVIPPPITPPPTTPCACIVTSYGSMRCEESLMFTITNDMMMLKASPATVIYSPSLNDGILKLTTFIPESSWDMEVISGIKPHYIGEHKVDLEIEFVGVNGITYEFGYMTEDDSMSVQHTSITANGSRQNVVLTRTNQLDLRVYVPYMKIKFAKTPAASAIKRDTVLAGGFAINLIHAG